MTEPLTTSSPGQESDNAAHEPALVMAAGSFLDLNCEELHEVCLGVKHLSGFGLRVSGEHNVKKDRWAEWGAAVKANGLKVFDVEVYRIGSELGPHIASVEELIHLAAVIGAENILVVGDSRDRDVVEQELRRIVSIATDAGVGVGLEYMAWTMPQTLDDARYLAEVTGCRLVVDVLHHSRLGATADDLALIVEAGVLGWVQVCDVLGSTPTDTAALIDEARHKRVVPGQGILPLRELLAVVPSSTTFSIEVQSDDLLRVDPKERVLLLANAAREVLGATFSR